MSQRHVNDKYLYIHWNWLLNLIVIIVLCHKWIFYSFNVHVMIITSFGCSINTVHMYQARVMLCVRNVWSGISPRIFFINGANAIFQTCVLSKRVKKCWPLYVSTINYLCILLSSSLEINLNRNFLKFNDKAGNLLSNGEANLTMGRYYSLWNCSPTNKYGDYGFILLSFFFIKTVNSMRW